jgi:hypothetical protein
MWRMRILAMLVVLVSGACAFAQGGNVTITGTVADPSGAMIAGAKVTVLQKSTSVAHAALTNASGQFNIPSLPPSTYSVTIEATGFKKYVQDVVMLADQIRDIDVRMQVGEMTQQVTVEESSVAVNTVSPELSQVIEQSRLVDIPLNGRNAADLTLTVPGAISANANNSGALQGDTKQNPSADAISVNGARPDQIGYNLDGANNEDLMSNVNMPFPFPDALQEFSVLTNSFDVQNGSNAGAVVNVITKGGTNKFHGDLFEFVRNRAFNAKGYFADKRDPLKRNQFGGTIGGPIFRDKMFFFFGYQRTIVRSVNNSTNAIIPIPQNLTGDFTNYTVGNVNGSNPKNPLSGGASAIMTQYPFDYSPLAQPNIVPSNLIDPVALAMAKLMPISSASANGTVTYGTPLKQDYAEYIGRVDQNFHNGDHLFGHVYINNYKHAPTYDGKNILTVGPGSTVDSQNWAIGYTKLLKSTMVNSLTIDFIRSASDRGQQGGPGGQVPDMKTFGTNIYQLPAAQTGIRTFGVSGDFTIGNFTDAKFIRNTYDLRDVFNWTKGKHDISFGYDLEIDQSNINNTDLENGSFSFNTDVTHIAMANFLLGFQNSFSQTSGDFSDSRENPMGVFGSDKWKVSPNLTLSFGARWEPEQVMKEKWGRIEQFYPDAWTAGVHSSIVPGAPAGLFFIGDKYNGVQMPDRGEGGDLNNIGPRVGIAWDPTGSGRMSIRAGGGLFFSSRLTGLFLNDAAISSPFSLRIDLSDNFPAATQIGHLTNPLGPNASGADYSSFTNGFPQRYIYKNLPKNPPFVKNPTVFGLQPGARWITPEIYNWNVTFERQLRGDAVFRASYVGTTGVHLRQDVNVNPAPYIAGSALGDQARRPYQPFGVIYQERENARNGYNAMQFNFEKRASAGAGILSQITLLANYTYAKAMDYGLAENGGITDLGTSLGSGMSFGNPGQKAFETGPASYDHANRAVASFVWSLPKFAQSNAAMKTIVGGWQWTGIYSFQTGDPLTILAGVDRSQSGNNLDRADLVSGATLGSRANPTACPVGTNNVVIHCQPWLNKSNFFAPASTAPDGSFGNIGKGTYRGPNLWDVDTGLLKNFAPIPNHENFSFQFRGEFFNLFNHPQWQDPNVTLSNGNIGTIRATVGTNADNRIIQLALKMNF